MVRRAAETASQTAVEAGALLRQALLPMVELGLVCRAAAVLAVVLALLALPKTAKTHMAFIQAEPQDLEALVL